MLRLFPRRLHVIHELLPEPLVLFFRPVALADQMLFQALDRVAQRERFPLVLRPVFRRVVAGRMRAAAIGDVLDQRRPAAAPGAVGGPERYRVDSQQIVAVDANAGNTEAEAAGGKRAALATGRALERRNRPLVVDDVQNDGRLVNRRKCQSVVKVGFRRAAVADPGCGDMVLALDRRCHRPANRLRELRRQVTRDGEHVAGLAVIHDRQLPALAHVACVGQALAHHVDELDAAIQEQPLVAVRREAHVPGTQRHALRDRHGLFAARLHVKRNSSLPLDCPHPIVEGTGQHHPAQRDLQLLRIEVRVPRSLCRVVVVEHAHQLVAQEFDVARARTNRRLVDAACRRQCQVAEIRVVTGSSGRPWYLQSRLFDHVCPSFAAATSLRASSSAISLVGRPLALASSNMFCSRTLIRPISVRTCSAEHLP